VAVGNSALLSNTANQNVAVGYHALFLNTTGTQNTVIGTNTMPNNTTGSNNTANGANALGNNVGGLNNTASGVNALIGNVSGNNNVAVGVNSLVANVTGSGNVALGAGALANSTVSSNTAVGLNALSSATTGSANTSIGVNAGNAITTGTNNVMVGTVVGSALTTGSNNIYIDGNSLAGANESNTIRIGNTHTRCFIKGISGVVTALPAVTVLVDANGQLGTVSSSARFKSNIADMADSSSFIYDLRPVTFTYNADADQHAQVGLIAEEVEKVAPEMVIYDEEGLPFTVRYEMLSPLLLNEVQKLERKVAAMDELASKVEFLEKAFANLKKQVAKFSKRS
jgi:hypothetical protein